MRLFSSRGRNIWFVKAEFVISGVRYMEGFYEGFLREKREETAFGS